MAQPPRPLLARISAILAAVAWTISLASLGLSSTTLHALAPEVPLGHDTLSAGVAPLQLGMSMQFMNGAMEGWAMAVGAFGIFAAGAIAALLSVVSGRWALRHNRTSATAAAGTTAGALYLACLVGVIAVGLPG
ncbi:MAG: hypothetical protein MK101_01265 [Phycisphaerales bacterium]|nr:hypothetical protein [Phycisphaerales bacterium]